MHQSNFPDDTHGNICSIDFEDVALVPLSFAEYIISCSRGDRVSSARSHSI
jgi:hypothetical protein